MEVIARSAMNETEFELDFFTTAERLNQFCEPSELSRIDSRKLATSSCSILL